jgi:hypothetical protein
MSVETVSLERESCVRWSVVMPLYLLCEGLFLCLFLNGHRKGEVPHLNLHFIKMLDRVLHGTSNKGERERLGPFIDKVEEPRIDVLSFVAG